MKTFALTCILALAGLQLWAQSPLDKLPKVPAFTVTSTDAQDGKPFATAQMGSWVGGKEQSPQLTWKGFPPGTKSFAVTMYDPDAPTGSGFWHWAVADIPASVTSLPAGAGSPDGKLLPPGAFTIPNDLRTAQFVGAAPPKGTGVHRYFIVVYALDTAQIDVPKDSTPAYLCFNLNGHTLARAVMVPVAGQ